MNTAVNEEVPLKEVALTLRLEGPYFAPAMPARYKTVVCFVAGTGISGALAIASCFRELESQRESDECVRSGGVCGRSGDCEIERMGSSSSTKSRSRVWKRCVVVWSVREDQFINLKGLESRFFILEDMLASLTVD